MNVHKVILMIVDHDDIGALGVLDELENTKYANHCMCPQVVSIESQDVIWTDDHPLNKQHTWRTAFENLFQTKGKG